MPTPWRTLLYKHLKTLEFSGKVLDLGGSKKSGYHELFGGDIKIEVVNIDSKYGFDHNFDLEQAFPLPGGSCDGVMAINTLEHIYNYRQFLAESFRVLKDGGICLIAVPFFVQIHPCPHDYWRYTRETLERLMREAGFKTVEVTAIGTGPGSVLSQVSYNAMRYVPLRAISAAVGSCIDMFIGLFKNKTSLREEYPLGYVVRAHK